MYRKKAGFTLRQLAAEAGCTHSYLSQLEKGVTVPSLSMVGKLAAALKISVMDLFNPVPNQEEVDWHLPKENRKTIHYPDGKVSSQLLVTRITTRKMEPLISTVEPGGKSDGSEGMRHPAGTEEFVLVMKGELTFAINGKKIQLRTGDTLSFDGSLPHSWVNNGTETSDVFFIFSPPIW